MKLTTSIPPRRDGTVIYRVADQRLVFGPDDDGRLVCEVPDQIAPRVLESPLFEAVQPSNRPRRPPPAVAASKQAVVKKGKKD